MGCRGAHAVVYARFAREVYDMITQAESESPREPAPSDSPEMTDLLTALRASLDAATGPRQLDIDGGDHPLSAPGARTRRQPIEVTCDRMIALAEDPHPYLSHDEVERLHGLVGALTEIIDGRRTSRPKF